MPRRIATYKDGYGFNLWNMVETFGAFIIAASLILFFANIMISKRPAGTAPAVGPDPWDARSLEWMVSSPPPVHNFDEVPTVSELDEFWHRKYGEDDDHRVVQLKTSDEVAQRGDAEGVHLPSPSYWPLVVAIGLPFIAYGLIFHLGFAAVGGLLVVAGIYGWGLEPATDDSGHGGAHGPEGHDAPHDPEPASVAAPQPDAAPEVAASDETEREVTPVD
jgi:cytochrome c oxidase subunit 1